MANITTLMYNKKVRWFITLSLMPLIINRYGKGLLFMIKKDIKMITEKSVFDLLTLKIDVMLVSRGLKRTKQVYNKAGKVEVSFVPPRRK